MRPTSRDDEYQSYAEEWLAAASQQERRIATLSSRCGAGYRNAAV